MGRCCINDAYLEAESIEEEKLAKPLRKTLILTKLLHLPKKRNAKSLTH